MPLMLIVFYLSTYIHFWAVTDFDEEHQKQDHTVP